MQDNILKKEFKKRDVERLRNLVTGKYGKRTSQGIGYTKAKTFHKEGDIWEEDGRQWTIKGGIKQNVTKLDGIKKLHKTPIFCPCCNKRMKKHFDAKYYKVHRKCYDCVLEMETKIRKLGKWDEYEKAIHNSDVDGYIKDFSSFIEDQINQSVNTYVTEKGDVEKWVGGINKDRAREALKNTVEQLNKLKK